MSLPEPSREIMQEISRLVGQLEQSVVDIRGDINRLETQMTALNTTLNALLPKLEQASKHAADWEVTKRRGILYLAAAGATGIASTLGFQKIGPLVFAILK